MTTDEGNPKIVQLQPPDRLVAECEAFKRNVEVLIENQKQVAKIRRAAYLAYVGEGFSEQQALELCCR